MREPTTLRARRAPMSPLRTSTTTFLLALAAGCTPERSTWQFEYGAAFVFLSSTLDGVSTLEVEMGDVRRTGVFQKEASGRYLGSSGDQTGDGMAGLLVGAPGSGRAYIVSGDTLLDPSDVSLGLSYATMRLKDGGGVGPERLHVQGAGDLDGDALGDLLYAGPCDPGGNQDSGCIVFAASVTSQVEFDMSIADVVLYDGEGAVEFAVPVGDATGDGVGDTVMGRGGVAYLLSGSDLGEGGRYEIADLAIATVVGDVGSGTERPVPIGDVDGDGRADVLLPHRDTLGYDGGEDDVMSARAFSGARLASGGTFGTEEPCFTLGGDDVVRNMRWFASAGDVDGDGRGDVLMAYHSGEYGMTGPAQVSLFLSPAECSGSRFGVASASGTFVVECGPSTVWGDFPMSALADMDDDGKADVLIGSPCPDDYAGRTWVVSGAALLQGRSVDETDPDAVLVSIHGRVPWGMSGDAVAAIPDLDADGLPEIAIGAPGYPSESR
ncbi:hypothetical protein L6R50_11615 [Myxococcota bacterium]|nr:hypothetical protein [Myxococcota bacterium]